MIEQWREQLQRLSGNFTTNGAMPEKLIDKLLDEDAASKEKIAFDEMSFSKLEDACDSVKGLNIVAGLQKINKEGSLTLFRSIRFPTHKRMCETVSDRGYSISNYEQERILEFYNDQDYKKERTEIKTNRSFWTQPQERVVRGLPLFRLVNDAIQIHRAFRGNLDRVAIVVIHIPYTLIESGKIKLIANAAIDLDFDNDGRDYEIRDYYKSGKVYEIDRESLLVRGIDLYEMYSNDLPSGIKEAEKIGIKQEFFLLDIYKVSDVRAIKNLFNDKNILKETQYFLHGLFGDQNIFGRRPTEYLPDKCSRISKRI